MKFIHKLSFLLISVFVLSACEQLLIPEDPTTDPVSIFEQSWNFVDQEYSFFTFKSIDWDRVYTEYRPRVNADMSERELFDLLAEMLFELRDGHVNLRSPFDLSRNWEWYLDSPENFNGSLLERNYYLSQQEFIGSLVLRDFGDIGYVRYGSFSAPVSEDDADLLVERFQDKAGLIFDVRNNGGGSLGNVIRLVSRFVSEETLVGIQREKTGPGHEEFGPWGAYSIEPEGSIQFTKPIVVLTNRRCFSATTFFATFMSALPHVTLVGDTTGGGGGAPSSTELSNGWVLRVSSTQLGTIDGLNVEDGLPPDERVDLDPTDEANGIDTMLEFALDFLR